MGRKGNSKKRHVTKRKFLTFIYTGYILEEKFQNYPHGSGKAFYNDGTIYEGLFSYGKREGLGKLEYNDGSIYYGLFRDDLRDGYGELKNGNGSWYSGTFRDDFRHGYGKYQCQCGCFYQGNYVNNRKSGDGCFIDPLGNIFKGRFFNNFKNGIGTLTYKEDNSKLSGCWKDDKLDNSESIIFRTKEGIYCGTWLIENRKLEGEFKSFDGITIMSSWTWTEDIYIESPKLQMYGTCLYSNSRGRYYSGYFKNSYPTLENNSFHGHGRITYENGCYYEGIFRDGRPTEFGWLIDKFGNSYQGQIKDDKPHGLGLEYTQEGLLIKGFFDKGNLVYSIFILERSGNYYRGEMENNDITGQGIYILASGRSYEGYFENGERVGVHLRTSSRGVQSKKEFGITYLD